MRLPRPSDRLRDAMQVVVDKVNKDINLILVSEETEERMIRDLFIEKVLPNLEPSLEAFMPAVYVTCIRMALNEELSREEKKERIGELVRSQMTEPLAKELNRRIEIKLISEGQEGKWFKMVAEHLIDEFVKAAIGDA